MKVIVTSQKDIAGVNVYTDLVGNFDFKEEAFFEGKPTYKRKNVLLISTGKGQVFANHLDNYFDADYYVFASRHKSASGEKTLTVHVPGNLTNEAKVGGRPKDLAYCNADAMKVALMELKKERDELGLDYKVSLEVTHHGPSELKKPVIFVEVGGSQVEWNDENAVRAVARASLKAAENVEVFKKGIGIGGGHYAPRHTMLVLESQVAIGHIIPSYAIDSIDKIIFAEAVRKTDAAFGFLDWKGMKKEQREKVLSLSKMCNLEVKRGRDFKVRSKIIGFKEFTIDEVLFKEAVKLESNKIRDFVVKEGGMPIQDEHGRLENRFRARKDIRTQLVEKCAEIISKNLDLRIEDKGIFVLEKRFDPKTAQALGIKPGPLFKKLSDGIEVKIDDRVIKPEDVIRQEKRSLDIKDEATVKMLEEKIFK
ncbi:MAG: D-aminoacyl-tRNA deacylase [Candidatus Hydrothermarchaeales archaeon]